MTMSNLVGGVFLMVTLVHCQQMNTRRTRTLWIVGVVLLVGLLGLPARQQRELLAFISNFDTNDSLQLSQPEVNSPTDSEATTAPILVLTTSAASTTSGLSISTTAASAQVIRVIDGDTIEVQLPSDVRAKVRLVGLDAPELNSTNTRPPECQAEIAREHLLNLLAGKTVTLEPDVAQADTDRYGRLLRFISVGGADIGAQMISAGLAKEYQYSKLPHWRVREYQEAQQQAQTAAIGIWNPQICVQ